MPDSLATGERRKGTSHGDAWRLIEILLMGDNPGDVRLVCEALHGTTVLMLAGQHRGTHHGGSAGGGRR